jgi:cytoskeletal protein CcmA (bactofilin family)
VFQFKPAPKNGSAPAGQTAGNGNGHENGHHPVEEPAPAAEPVEQSNTLESKKSQIAAWLGLGGGRQKVQPRPAAPRPTHGKGLDSVVGPGVSLQGTLTGAGNMRIEGSFDGTISIQGTLFVADGAKVTAEIRAGAVSVGGSVKGNITAGKVEILSTGRVWGDLITTAFATEEGAFLRGQVRMEDNLPTPPATPMPQPQVLPTAVMAREREREAVRRY